MPAKTRARKPVRTLDARPDTLDFRDRMYEATLIEVPQRIDLRTYLKWKVPILDQGQEGACTGFGLATVANYLLRSRRVVADRNPVSPRMLYEMAKRYDEWPGEQYDGSSARGAMKGWHKHGVCGEKVWPYRVSKSVERILNNPRAVDASRRPLGAYYRVNHKDLVCMHSAMAEVGVLYATAIVHEGWDRVGANGDIPRRSKVLGGHAFAIVAYDERGFWIQNSWGKRWGKDGFGLLTYDDWLEHATDVWVARLGASVVLQTPEATAMVRSAIAGQSELDAFHELRPHIISIGNDGRLRSTGTYGTTQAQIRTIFQDDFPRVTKTWRKKRLLLYAHGGLTNESSAIQRVADYRTAMLHAEVYPLAFIWKTDFWTTLTNILQDAIQRRRPEGLLGKAKDFMLDRLDDALEPLARTLTGKALWDEMKENALLATVGAEGGARLVLEQVAELVGEDPSIEIHLVGHSAGGIFHGPLTQVLSTRGAITGGPAEGTRGLGLKINSCTLWAPACTTNLFKQAYLPSIKKGTLGRFALFTLTDKAEQDDHCANVYHKSLLYLVSHALESKPRIPFFQEGQPVLGMEKFVSGDPGLQALFNGSQMEWVLSPNTDGGAGHSTSLHHGDFDDDMPTLRATLARIVGTSTATGQFRIHRSAASLQNKRELVLAR